MKITKIVLFITLSLLFVQMMAVSDLKASTMPISNDDIQIKTKQGQIIKFLNDKIFVVGLGYALIEEFVHPNNISPMQRKDESKIVVQYNNLWHGIDLRYEERDKGLIESIYTIKPNADISKIKIKYNKEVEIQDDGKLKIKNERGYFTLSAPIAWQVIDNKKSSVDVAFISFDKHTVGYKVGKYDKRYPLIIDPVLDWNTFFGSNMGEDQIYGIAVGKTGNIYAIGYSYYDWGLAINPYNGNGGSVEMVLVAMNNDGSYRWHSFFGSPFRDEGYGIILDNDDNIYITGYSVSNWGFPIEQNYRSGGFAVYKVNANGYLQWNTLLCTNHNTGENIGNSGTRGIGITLDKDKNVYVTGYCSETWNTTTGNVPPKNPFTGGEDILIAKLDNSGNLKWHTFHGGMYSDVGYGIAVDQNSNVYVTGYSDTTWGSNVKNNYSGGNDIFVLKLDSNGNYQWNSFFGSNETDRGQGIAIGGDGYLYLTGYSYNTWSANNIQPKNAHSGGNDIVVMKLSSNGDYQWHTFYGSSGDDRGNGISLSNNGGVYLIGYSYSSWSVGQSNPINAYSGDKDIVVLKLDTDGNYKWHGFYGSSVEDVGRGIAVDSSNNIYIGGFSNATWGTPKNPFSASSELTILKIKDDTVTATYPLTVGKSGTGSGTVTSTPAGIDCGNNCTANFNAGTLVTLTATTGSNSTFAGWSGDCSGSTNTCTVTMNGAKNVTATFNSSSSNQRTLTVSKTGTGSGTVTSTPTGINCGSTCSANFNAGTLVNLTATADTGSTFAGWSGDCSGSTNTCTVTMDAVKNVTATFNITITKSPIYRFYNSNTGGHFFTASVDERNMIINNLPDFRLESNGAFFIYTNQISGSNPVYRMFSRSGVGHFYTIDDSVKEVRKKEGYELESIGFYAYSSQITGTKPVYYFYVNTHTNNGKEAWFYTISEVEKDYIVNNLSNSWRYIGVAFYAFEN